MECFLDNFERWSSALLTPLLALIGTWILYNQYRLQKLKWRLDLYDKRYPVFISTMEYIAYIVQHHNVTDEILFKFLRDSKDKEFLFGNDIKDHLRDLYNKGLDLQVIESRLRRLSKGEEPNKEDDKSTKLFQWFNEQFEVSKKLFGNYLSVDQK